MTEDALTEAELDALVAEGRSLEAHGERDAAATVWRQILARRPQTAYAHYRLGWLAYQAGQWQEALAHHQRALAYAPGWYEPAWHAGTCCVQLRDYPNAHRYYQQAIAAQPDLAVLWYHAGRALKDDGQLDAAMPYYQQALALDPASPDIHYSQGLLHLLRGEWALGWPGYEQRFAGSDRADKEHRPLTRLPRWQGEIVPPDSGLVVYAEQGMGDALMLWRYASPLRERFRQVKFAMPAPLVRLLSLNAPPGVDVVPRVAGAINEDGYTHQIDLMSLPACFGTTPDTVPCADRPYLVADPEAIKAWQERLAADPRPKIGLVWEGGALTQAPARDMPFEALQPLLARKDICWVSLQRDLRLPEGSPVHDWMPEVSDMADTAALIANLDAVIAVDTAVAHLAGALGKPVWLLNRYESEWRWLTRKSHTPWYPSMQLLQQPTPGDWASLIAQLNERMLPTLFTLHRFPENAMTLPKTFLHIGCGPKYKDKTTRGFNTDDWKELRFDIDESVKPDLVGTMTDMSAVASESVDAIFSSHNIEHLYAHEVPLAFAEFLRVLKPDGFLVATCPDLKSVCALVADDKLLEAAYTSPAGPIAPLDILYGHRPAMARGNLFMAHRCGFTQKVLDGTLRSCGFTSVATLARSRAPFYDLWVVASKSARPEDEIRDIAMAHFPK